MNRLLFALSLLMASAADAHRLRRHSRSLRPNSAEICATNWLKRANLICRYPAQAEPCFTTQRNGEDDLFKHIMNRCCSTGCSRPEMESFCCTEKSCLSKCYSDVRDHNQKHVEEIMHLAKVISGRGKRHSDFVAAKNLLAGLVEVEEDAEERSWKQVDAELKKEPEKGVLTAAQVRLIDEMLTR